MLTKIRKWGNSQGLCIPKAVLAGACLEVGDEVDVSVRDGKIEVSPTRQVRGKYRLEDLLAQMPDDYVPEEVDWGRPVGREVW